MDGLRPFEDLERELAEVDRKVNLDLSIRRVRLRIDRALDVGNRRQFIELCGLLRDYQARDSRASATP